MCDAPSIALPQSTPRVFNPGRSGIFTAVAQSCLSFWRNRAMAIDLRGSSMKLRVFFRLFLLGALLSGLSSAAPGQTTASIKGTVTDASGGAISGAKVTVKGAGSGIERTVMTKDRKSVV